MKIKLSKCDHTEPVAAIYYYHGIKGAVGAYQMPREQCVLVVGGVVRG